MQKSLLTIFTFFILAFGTQAAQAYYDWTSYGSCAEYNYRGSYLRTVDSDVCRRTVGSEFEWNRYGNCEEVTPRGASIRTVADFYCRNVYERPYRNEECYRRCDNVPRSPSDYSCYNQCDGYRPRRQYDRDYDNRCEYDRDYCN